MILYLGKATSVLPRPSVTYSWQCLGFLTTFVLLARGTYTPREMVSVDLTCKSEGFADVASVLDSGKSLFWVSEALFLFE